MKLMIELSQEEYEFLKDLEFLNVGRCGYKTIQQNVINAIKFGTPITEGDMISRSALKEKYIKLLESAKELGTQVSPYFIDNAPSIANEIKMIRRNQNE